MRELIYFVGCSLDGFIAQIDGSYDGFCMNNEYLSELFTDFPETVPSHFREAMGIQAENHWFDTVLMGRKTYEVGLKEGVTSPYAHLKQYLFSRSLSISSNEAVTLISENAIAHIQSLKVKSGKKIWLCGGGNLASTLFTAGLIDTLILKINPFMMGTGIPLFAEPVPQTALELMHTKQYAGGVLRLHYQIHY